jgi:hypothetical protein
LGIDRPKTVRKSENNKDLNAIEEEKSKDKLDESSLLDIVKVNKFEED